MTDPAAAHEGWAESLIRPYLSTDGEASAAEAGDPEVAILRPYLLTAGRVRPIDESLAVEAQVVTSERGMASYPHLAFEHRDIIDLCVVPMSVAEVAARLGY